jgi:hypothetical protein
MPFEKLINSYPSDVKEFRNVFIRLLYLTVVVMLVFASIVAKAQIVPASPKLLNTNGTSDSETDLFVDLDVGENGVWLAVWTSRDDLGGTIGTDPDLLFARSFDHGQNWTEAALLNSNGTTDSMPDELPAIATDKNGNWIVVWFSNEDLGGIAGSDRDIFFVVSADNGASWSSPALLNTNAAVDSGNEVFPGIATDGNGNWVATWQSTDDMGGTVGTDEDAFFSLSTDNGSSWSPPALLNTTGTSDSEPDFIPSIAMDDSGNWYVVWYTSEDIGGTSDAETDIFFTKSTDYGANWTAPTLVNSNGTTDSSEDREPQLAIDDAGNLLVAWHTDENIGGAGIDQDVYFVMSSDGGSTWTDPTLLNSNGTTDEGDDSWHALTVYGAGNWMVVWQSDDYEYLSAEGDGDVYFSVSNDFGTTWSASALLNTNGSSDSRLDRLPVVATDGAGGHWVAAWSSTENLNGTAGTDEDILFTTFTTNFDPSPILIAVDPLLTNDNTPAITGTINDPDASILVTVDGQSQWAVNLGSTWILADNSYAIIADGSYVVSAMATDLEGFEKTAEGSLVIDTVLPAITVDALETNDTSPPLSGTVDDPQATISVTVNGQNFAVTNAGTTWSIPDDELTPLLNGLYDVMTTATDPAGNVGTDATFFELGIGSFDLLSVPFYLDDGSNFSGNSPPSDGAATFVGIKNTGSSPIDLRLTYTDTDGVDHTPNDDTYTLAGNSTVSWRPYADDSVEGGVSGQLVPNTIGGPAWGSIGIVGADSITGRLIQIDGSQNSTAMMLLPDEDAYTRLSVPFYLDNAPNLSGGVPPNRTASFVGVKNMRNVPITLTLTYTDDKGNDFTPPNNTYDLPGNSMVSWRPFADDPIEGDNSGRLVPNTNGGPAWGSILVEANGPITGRLFLQDGGQNSTAMMLLPGLPSENQEELRDLVPSRRTSIASSTDSNQTPEIASDGRGTWIAVWYSDDYVDGALQSWDILFRKSTDNGSTWTPPRVISSKDPLESWSDIDPHIATDGNGNWMVVWSALDNDAIYQDFDIHFSVSNDNGGTWSLPKLLDSNGNNDSARDFEPRVTTDRAGNWIVTWHSNENVGGETDGDTDVFVARTSNFGASWARTRLLNTNGITDVGEDYAPTTATDGLGNWIAVWASTQNLEAPGHTDWDIFFAISTNNGANWSDPKLLNTNGNTDSGVDLEPDIATDRMGNWVVTWRSNDSLGGTEGADNDIFVATSTDHGQSWSDPRALPSGSGQDYQPEIATDGLGDWVVTWRSGGNNFSSVEYSISHDNGFSWSGRQSLSRSASARGGNRDFQPDIASDRRGNWIGVWRSRVGDYYDASIQVARFKNPSFHELSVPFYLDNASNFEDDQVPTDGTASFVGVKNISEDPAILRMTYTDDKGVGHTPRSNHYVLAGSSMVSWRPSADDPVEGEQSGRLVPNTNSGPPWGSIQITANSPITGRLIMLDGRQQSTAMMLLPDGTPTTKLSVPFYLDNAANFSNGQVPGSGTASFVGVKNMSGAPITLTLTYSDDKGNDFTPPNNTYVLAANSMVSWRPFADDPVEGDQSGRLVPNTDGGPEWGSILIEADGPITGRLIHIDGAQQSTAMMLLPGEE